MKPDVVLAGATAMAVTAEPYSRRSPHFMNTRISPLGSFR
jgi:hypothetical protein